MTVQDMMRSHGGLVLAGIASFVLMGAGQSLYGPALPAFSRSFGITLSQAGMAVSAHWIGCFVGVGAMFLAGRHISPRIALTLMALGAAGVALQTGWGLTLLAAVLFGAGYGCATAVFNPRVLAAFADRGPSMLSLLNATFAVGAILSPLLFVAMGSDPRLSFAGVAVLMGLVAVFASARRTGGPSATVDASATPAPDAAPGFRLHLPILTFGAFAIGMESALIGLGPAALINAGLSEVSAATHLSAFFVTFLLARIVLVFTAHRVGSFTLYTGAVALATIAGLGAVLADPGIAFVVLGICAGLFFPGFYVTASRKMGADPRVPPTIIAAGLVGGIAAPLLITPFLGSMGERGFFVLLACVSGGLTLAALALWRIMNR